MSTFIKLTSARKATRDKPIWINMDQVTNMLAVKHGTTLFYVM